MSVVVNGMKMPENCWECEIKQYDEYEEDYVCPFRFSGVVCLTIGRQDSCPLVEVPEKHGRLIDADALIKFVEDRYEITWESDCYEGGIKDACSDIIEKIDTMPTVIEAEDE